MAKNQGLWIIGAIIVIGALVFLSSNGTFQALTGAETMTMTAQQTMVPGDSFPLTLTAQGVTGNWGATVEVSLVGPCTFPSGSNSYKTVMLAEDGLTKTVSIQSHDLGSGLDYCSFAGSYQYYDENSAKPIKSFPTLTVNFCEADCGSSRWSLQDDCTEQMDDGCGGTCTRTVVQNTNADIDCDGSVDRAELGTYITGWINNQISREELGQVIVAWIGG